VKPLQLTVPAEPLPGHEYRDGVPSESSPNFSADHPRGHWSAEPPPSPGDEDADHKVRGDVIRVAWDYGVLVPLWDQDGLLPEEPEWLRRALGISDALIRDLFEWGQDMNELDASGDPSETVRVELDQRARNLAGQLQRALGSRFTVGYEPW